MYVGGIGVPAAFVAFASSSLPLHVSAWASLSSVRGWLSSFDVPCVSSTAAAASSSARRSACSFSSFATSAACRSSACGRCGLSQWYRCGPSSMQMWTESYGSGGGGRRVRGPGLASASTAARCLASSSCLRVSSSAARARTRASWPLSIIRCGNASSVACRQQSTKK